MHTFVLAVTLIIPAGSTPEQIATAAATCGIGAVTVGTPSRLDWLITEADLPAIVYEHIENVTATYELDLGDGTILTYEDSYEAAHEWEVNSNVECGL